MTKQRGIQSLETGIGILDVFLKAEKPLTFIEVQELTGITKSNLYKYFYTLLQNDLLYKSEGAYILGTKLIEYGNIAVQNLDFVEQITPFLKEISEQTNTTSLLTVWSQGNPVITKINSANYGLHIGAELGTTLPLLSSTGKIFSVFYKGEEKDAWELRQLSKLTEDEKSQFLKDKKMIETSKFVYMKDPLIKHVSSISVPILNFNHQLIAAITIVGYSPTIPNEVEDVTSKFILKIAQDISESFGYRS